MNDSKEQVQGYSTMSDEDFKLNFSKADDIPPEFSNDKMKLPDPPKKGDLLICQICNQPIYPRIPKFLNDKSIPERNFMSENKVDAKREYKFHFHHACREEALHEADRNTPHLLAERKDLYKMLNE